LGYLVLYNLIFILPLVIIMLIASNKALLTKVEQWRNNKLTRLRLFSGIAMILLGILILIL
jgi:cytochrome c biogenesis protein CcdA